jgi:hypothetical protein
VTAQLVVPARFNGPAGSGNGGYVCGSLADLVPHPPGAAVEVTLRRPPPLDTPMTFDGSALTLAGELVAVARVVEVDLPPVDEVSADVAGAAMLRFPGRADHPFPTCFGCGTGRVQGDGLRIFPGPVGADRGLVASTWVPHVSHGSGEVDGLLRCGPAVTWAALDCVGGWSEDLEGRPCVLGRMTARLDALPVVGEPHVVVGRRLGREGRKSFTASTLYDADGRVVAAARHTWVQVDPSVFNRPPQSPPVVPVG